MTSTPDIATSTGPTMTSLPADPSSTLSHLTAGTHSVTLNAEYFAGLLAGNGLKLKSSQGGEKVFSYAEEVLEWVAWKKSGSASGGGGVWVFDDAEAVGVGKKLVQWSEEEEESTLEVNEVQTREGAGSGLVGYLNGKLAISTTSPQPELITLFATTTTLPFLLPALSLFPSAELTNSKIIIHLATTSIDPDTLKFNDSFAEIVTLLPSVPAEKFVIVFSSTPEEIVDTAAKVYGGEKKHVIHVYESTHAARQIQAFTLPQIDSSSGVINKFSSYGPVSSARELVILPASRTANILIASGLFSGEISGASAGLIVLNSWTDLTGLSKLIPLSGKGKKLFILNETAEGRTILKENVLAGLIDPEGSPSRFVFPNIKSIVIPQEGDVIDFVKEAVPALAVVEAVPSQQKFITFFTSQTEPLPELLTQLFLASPKLDAKLAQYGSASTKSVKSVLTLGTSGSNGVANPAAGAVVGESDVIWVTEPQVLKQVDVLSGLKQGGLVVLVFPWSEEEVETKLTSKERQILQSKQARIFLLPPTESPIVQQVAFLMLYTSSKMLSAGVKRVLEAYYDGNVPRSAVEEAQANLTEVEGVERWDVSVKEGEEEKEKESWEWDALAGREGVVDTLPEEIPIKGDWALAAKHFLFKEAFEFGADVEKDEELKEKAILNLRPSVEDKTYLVKVSENRRLTPETYDRNVFHIAFDTSGTGLKYEVGEALGVHAWNDADEVRDFISWYGLGADDIVSVPSPHDNGKTFETRTVFQILQQNLDIFGKPGKAFYASLGALAKDRNDQRTLRFIAAPEGQALFKRMSEKETVTFADVLQQFKSARPSFEELVGLVPEIKPRHYSIASSNAAVGDSVELLVVTVDWVAEHATGKSSPRFGQATRYLAALPVGAQVTVSIKPSVMKLPPLDTQPIIMAGLGTGAAPFRAFIQHRAWQKSQGIEVGPLLYYFGSRYRSQEYLYGEEIEAYIASGVVTHAGLAFSRDGKEKSYIQHKMTQDKELLAKILNATGPDAGYFYLCGPTWPVPDVYAALHSALQESGKSADEAAAYLDELKEEERYVLEVY